MKIWIMVCLLGMLCTEVAASVMVFYVKGQGSNAVYSVRSRAFTGAEMKAVLCKLHELDKDQTLYVSCSESNTVAELFQFMCMIKDAGFDKILISVPSMRGEKHGAQFLSIHLGEMPETAPSCVGKIKLDNGFWDSTLDLTEVKETNTNSTQQCDSPLPPAPQAGHSEGGR